MSDLKVIIVDDIIGTNAYIGMELQPKMEGATYLERGAAEEAIERLTEARDMYKYVFTCAKEVKDLDESTGVPIKGGSRLIAKQSLYHVINEVSEWEND